MKTFDLSRATSVAAFTWYEKAATQGYGEGYTNLGYMYDLGLGVAQDRAKAIDLYRQGAEKGSLNAMLNLGISLGKVRALQLIWWRPSCGSTSRASTPNGQTTCN